MLYLCRPNKISGTWFLLFEYVQNCLVPCTIHPPCLTFRILFGCINTNNAIICVEAKTIYVKRISVNIFNFIHIECKQMMFLRAHKKKDVQNANSKQYSIQRYIFLWIELAEMIYMQYLAMHGKGGAIRDSISTICMSDSVYGILHSQTPNTLHIVYSTFYEIVLWIVNRHPNTLIHDSYEYV